MAACYHPSGVQILTTGSDCKIGYWEVYDGSLIREIDGSRSSVLNAIDISRDGEYVLTGGDDKYVKVRHDLYQLYFSCSVAVLCG
jgi:WD40 repeat protein